jgi:2-methylcitrate dehydratase PrpD
MDAIQRFTENVVRTTYEMLPASALVATKTFILDTLGVCVAGSTAPGVSALVNLLRGWGGTPESSLYTYGGKLPAPWAAMANSVMMHNLEFDCVHDLAVVHPFTTALPAALAVAEAPGRCVWENVAHSRGGGSGHLNAHWHVLTRSYAVFSTWGLWRFWRHSSGRQGHGL